jgi:ribosomal-protein-alanine N-acetyltransferase
MADFKLPLEGERVIVRKLYKRDIEALFDLDSDGEVKRYVGGPVTKPRQEWIDGMRQLVGRRNAVVPLCVADKKTNEFIGRTSLTIKDMDEQCWEIQVLMGKKYWGKRLGREVCQLLMTAANGILGARSVIAVIDPRNAASRALVDAFGFVQVGTNRSGRWDDGHLVYRHQPT